MPHYYFNLFNDEVTIDREGAMLPDMDAALDRARREARSLAADSVGKFGHLVLHHRIVLLDAQRNELAEVAFGDVVEVRD